MSCAFSKELLALHVENDLPETEGRTVAKHLQECTECGEFIAQLGLRQSQLKRLRHESIPESTFTRVRAGVLSQIEDSQRALGWSVWIERTLWLGFRRHALVFTSLAIAAVSATVFAQMRQPALQDAAISMERVAVFVEDDVLLRPAGYREWVSIGSSLGSDVSDPHAPAMSSSGRSHNVYMDLSAYRAYSKTGKFPEGSVLVLETSGATARQPVALQASVKDSRFDGGWGFFDFTNSDGTIKDKTLPIAGKSSCRTCHEERAKFDHVFTQFHPALKTAT